jgi:hypothetical protein
MLYIDTHHLCWILPKFHCELNPIERVWAIMKWYSTRHSDGTMSKLKANMELGLSQEILTLQLIRKFVNTTLKYVIAYSIGLDIVTADWVMKKHRSHRKPNSSIDNRLNEIIDSSDIDGDKDKAKEFVFKLNDIFKYSSNNNNDEIGNHIDDVLHNATNEIDDLNDVDEVLYDGEERDIDLETAGIISEMIFDNNTFDINNDDV